MHAVMLVTLSIHSDMPSSGGLTSLAQLLSQVVALRHGGIRAQPGTPARRVVAWITGVLAGASDGTQIEASQA